MRSLAGGVMMGMANLVPGISGGTMLVAAGIYTRFIDAISELTRLRLRPEPLVVVGSIVAAALTAIALFAGVIAWTLVEFRWAMYSLFIGLTLGGAPILVRMIRGSSGRSATAAVIGTIAGLLVMIGVLVAESMLPGGGGAGTGPVMLVLGGVAGASAMILPGISGAYLLLVLGQYDTIINAVKDAGRAAVKLDVPVVMDQLPVLVPVGIGVVAGVVGVSNLLKFVLKRYEKATLGVLLGLLLGSPLGLYPFREGVPPAAGDVMKGQTLTEQTAAEVKPKDWPQRAFTPGAGHIAGSLALIAVGIGATLGVARLGGERSGRG